MHLDIDILKYVCMHGRQKSCFKWTGIEKRYPIWTIVLLKRFFNHSKFTCRFNQYGTLWDIDTDESVSYLKYQTSLKIFNVQFLHDQKCIFGKVNHFISNNVRFYVTKAIEIVDMKLVIRIECRSPQTRRVSFVVHNQYKEH